MDQIGDSMTEDARFVRIEEDIKLINSNVAKLYATLAKTTSADAIWRKTMCIQHGDDLKIIGGELDKMKPKIDSKWPAILSAFAGSMVSMIITIGAVVVILQGVNP